MIEPLTKVIVLSTGEGVGVGAGAGVGAGPPEVRLPVTGTPPLPGHCVDIVDPLIVNVATGTREEPSRKVIATVAVLPLAVPFTFCGSVPQPVHLVTAVPATVDPLCVRVIVSETAPVLPIVPDHVPLKGPADEGVVGVALPPPHEIVTTINARQSSPAQARLEPRIV